MLNQHCKWASKGSKEYKEMNDESTKYCEQCYSRNNSLLLSPVLLLQCRYVIDQRHRRSQQ